MRSLRSRKTPLLHVTCSTAKRYGYHSRLWSELNHDERFSISIKAHWRRADKEADEIIQDSYNEYIIHGYQLAELDNYPLDFARPRGWKKMVKEKKRVAREEQERINALGWGGDGKDWSAAPLEWDGVEGWSKCIISPCSVLPSNKFLDRK